VPAEAKRSAQETRPAGGGRLVKVLNACPAKFNRYWVFSASATTLFYRMVYDAGRGAQKIYVNYPGSPAPAVTVTSAFATCP
jgi:hypothetical protein